MRKIRYVRDMLKIVVLSVAVFTSLSLWAESGILEKEGVRSRIREEITKLDLSASLSLIDTEITKGLGFGTKYKAEVEPAYLDGVYTRVDKWSLNATFSAGSVIEEFGSPLFMGLSKGAEVILVRHYKSQWNASKAALALDPRKIPLTAEKATKHLRPGESILLPVNLNLFTGVQGTSLSGGLEGKIGQTLFLNGKFLLQVLRLDGEKVRLRLVAQRNNGSQLFGKIETDFELFSVSTLDKLVSKLIVDDLLKLSKSKTNGVIYIADYLFDLGNAEAAKAYDNIMATGFKLKDVEVIDPFRSAKDISKLYVNDLSAAERIAIEDKDLPDDEKRVRKIFEGLNTYASEGAKMEVGFRLAQWKGQNSFTKNKVNFVDSDFKESNFLYPTEASKVERRLFWGLYKEKSRFSRSILYDLDAPKERFSNYVISFEERDKNMTLLERTFFLRRIQQQLPESLVREFNFDFFSKPSDLTNARILFQVVFHKEAFLHLKGMSERQLRRKFDKFIEANRFGEMLKSAQNPCEKRIRQRHTRNKRINLCRAQDFITPFISTFAEIVNSDLGTQDDSRALRSFVELRENPVFKKFSTGYFISLVENSRLKDNVFIQLRTDSVELESEKQSFGDESKLETLNAMEYIQNLIGNGSFDLRLETFGTPIRTID